MLRCRSAESTRFFFASIDHVILWWRTHTHKLKSTGNVMIHGILLICMPCLGCWQPLCLAAGLALLALVLWFRWNDSGEEQLLKFSGKLAHSKVSSENSFFLDFNLFYDASSINCQFNPTNSTVVWTIEIFNFLLLGAADQKQNTFPGAFRDTLGSGATRHFPLLPRIVCMCPPFDHSK